MISKTLKQSSNKGITLVALVITIIVLVILAGVSINLVLGDNGIINKAKLAKENTEIAANEEQLQLAQASDEIDEYISNSRLTDEEIENKIGMALMDVDKAEVITGLTVSTSKQDFIAEKTGFYNFMGQANNNGFGLDIFNKDNVLLCSSGDSDLVISRYVQSGYIYLKKDTKVKYLIYNVGSAKVVYCPPISK